MAQFKYLGQTVTNQNLIQPEIMRRSNSGNACYYSDQNLLSSRLLSKNIKIKIHKSIILPVVLYMCETWSPKLREEHRLRVKSEVLTAVVMKRSVFWDITQCSPLKVNQSFVATCFHASILLGLFGSENGGDNFLRNVG
jgi:hypothetical protein